MIRAKRSGLMVLLLKSVVVYAFMQGKQKGAEAP
ncbi:protein of unknown function [Shewanella benthica]|uniref:Uncharacterized protein n=1 Tax=Shewanella benthica TaxID=43661 RepID=A0A330LVK3_9GAMM|nr:protein of unknown function [Shewanella benthica]